MEGFRSKTKIKDLNNNFERDDRLVVIQNKWKEKRNSHEIGNYFKFENNARLNVSALNIMKIFKTEVRSRGKFSQTRKRGYFLDIKRILRLDNVSIRIQEFHGNLCFDGSLWKWSAI